jgi:hypothetical protein
MNDPTREWIEELDLNGLSTRRWESRLIVGARRRIAALRTNAGERPELVLLSLKEQAQVLDALARRLSASRDETEELCRLRRAP